MPETEPTTDPPEPEETDPVDLELEWDEIRALKPSQLARHLTDLGRSANGNPRVLRERLAAAVGAEPPDPPPLTVLEAITAVKEAIGAIDKDRQMSQGATYRYRGIDAILDAAHAALVATGLLIVPERATPSYDLRTTDRGKASQWVSLHVSWRIYGPSGDSIFAATVGEASDVSDKATNKAHTAAWKVLLSQLFAIPYSVDDHDDERPDAGEPLSPAELEAMAGLDRARAQRADRLQESLDNLPPDLYERAVEKMTDRAKKAGATIGVYDSVDALGEGEVLDSWLGEWDKLLVAAWKKAEEDVPAAAPAEVAAEAEHDPDSHG